MKQLIVFSGKMNGIFFKNEITYIKNSFDKVIVLSYPCDKAECQRLAMQYDFEYYIVPSFSFYSFFNSVKQIFFDRAVRKEKNRRTLKQLLYIFLYLCWANAAEKIYKVNCINNNADTFLYSFWLSRGAYAACRIANKYPIKKIVSRAHEYDLYEERNSMKYLPFRNYIAETLDEIHFISLDGLNYFKNKNKNCKSKLYVTRLGTKKTSYRKISYVKQTICIASCSAIVKRKRIDLIIDVLSKLNTPFLWIHLGDGNLKVEMERYAQKKLKKGSYEFLGHISNQEIKKIYEKYDVDFFLNLSDSEGVPVSIMEAMSMGIPAIARDVGGNREIVDHKNGLLLKESATYEEQLEKIVEKRFQEDEYESLTKVAYGIWEQNYWDEKNYRAFFNNMAKL